MNSLQLLNVASWDRFVSLINGTPMKAWMVTGLVSFSDRLIKGL